MITVTSHSSTLKRLIAHHTSVPFETVKRFFKVNKGHTQVSFLFQKPFLDLPYNKYRMNTRAAID
jgi:hypothetical protein